MVSYIVSIRHFLTLHSVNKTLFPTLPELELAQVPGLVGEEAQLAHAPALLQREAVQHAPARRRRSCLAPTALAEHPREARGQSQSTATYVTLKITQDISK